MNSGMLVNETSSIGPVYWVIAIDGPQTIFFMTPEGTGVAPSIQPTPIVSKSGEVITSGGNGVTAVIVADATLVVD